MSDCDLCRGRGWIVTLGSGAGSARRCPCRTAAGWAAWAAALSGAWEETWRQVRWPPIELPACGATRDPLSGGGNTCREGGAFGSTAGGACFAFGCSSAGGGEVGGVGIDSDRLSGGGGGGRRRQRRPPPLRRHGGIGVDGFLLAVKDAYLARIPGGAATDLVPATIDRLLAAEEARAA